MIEQPSPRVEIPRWKRALDVTLILVTVPFWATIMILVALWIKAVSPGPVFFRQERVGHRGRRFMMFKFRSMKVHAEVKSHECHFDALVASNCPMTKLDAVDNRLIPGGRILRAAGLDEMPQIINVLRGEMSLVGPRPCTSREMTKFPGPFRERFNAPPGLTGYWQVNGKNKTTFTEMVEFDIYYSRHMSLGMDLSILGRTLPVLVELVRDSQARFAAGRTNVSGAKQMESPGVLEGAAVPAHVETYQS
jgi:lipopolysaccharide/colanic/teichoic acid biosynthesis glycosyltransferase